MKVVILADCLTTQNTGIYYYVHQWITRVIKTYPSHDYILITSDTIDDFDLEQIIVPINNSIPFHLRIRQLITIPTVIKKIDPDWVIETAHFGPFFTPKSIKRATIIHDLTPITHSQFHDFMSVWMHKMLIKGIIKRSDAIITNSETTKREIIEYTGKDESDIVVNYPKIDEHKVESSLKRKNIVTIGTIEPRKDQITLLKAFVIVAHNDQNIELTIIGKNGWKNQSFWEYYSSISKEIKARINLLEYVAREDLMTELNSSSLFVFPSIVEGFGLPILEAMRFGIPLILSDTAINREVGGEAALYFDLRNYEDLASIILKTINEEATQHDLSEKSKRGILNSNH